jgi:hypothetical protein
MMGLNLLEGSRTPGGALARQQGIPASVVIAREMSIETPWIPARFCRPVIFGSHIERFEI